MGSSDLSQRKNILFLIADDLGKCLPCYGAKGLKTPNIDKFAADAVAFDMAFTSTASCSASRTVMYTGLHPHENGQYGLIGSTSHFSAFDHIESGPRLFNALGYQTGIIGKVHVGPPQVFPYETREESETRNVAWTADRVEKFFEKANETQRPFFLTVGYVDPHRDISTRGEFGNHETCDGTFKIPDFKEDEVEIPPWLTDLAETRIEYVEYYKAISRLDYGIGLVLKALERHGLADSTMVVVNSDNGPPFINSKTTLYDAGTQLPFIIRIPGMTQRGIHNPNMISYIDILPTFLDWAGASPDFSSPVPVPKDQVFTAETRPPPSPPRLGRSFLNIIERSDVLPPNLWQHKVYGSHTFHELANYWPTRFLHNRKYKYHRNIAHQLDFPFASDLYASLTLDGIRRNGLNGKTMIGKRTLKQYVRRPAEELYDLEKDPLEVNNLAGKKEFESILLEMRRDVEAWQLKTKDPWLYRDGQSLIALSRYRQDGLQIPNSVDFVIDSDQYKTMKKYDVDDQALVNDHVKL